MTLEYENQKAKPKKEPLRSWYLIVCSFLNSINKKMNGKTLETECKPKFKVPHGIMTGLAKIVHIPNNIATRLLNNFFTTLI